MTESKFNLIEMDWAKKVLSEPSYIMPNGRKSHDVAYEVLNKALDRILDENHLNANGKWR